MAIKVFKFGGASVSSPERVFNVSEILKMYDKDKLVIVISAMGKTTNELEEVVQKFYGKQPNEAKKLFDIIKNKHEQILHNLIPQPSKESLERFNSLCDEVYFTISQNVNREYDYYYDQIVSIGELLSTSIISSYLNDVVNIKNVWVDIRDVLVTDNNYRDATIMWDLSLQKTKQILHPIIQTNNIVIIQGFIGATTENETTTLGREGSDYTAAIFANILDAQSQTIWKDVEGVMNADPKIFNDAIYISELNYNEVIEMAYYGAQVIHPKTMKPLHNKSIPLHVKCFLNPTLQGTTIHNQHVSGLPPIIMLKKDQVLLKFTTKDLSFVSEQPLLDFYNALNKLKIRANLIQTEAIAISLVIDNKPEKITQLINALDQYFDYDKANNLSLITIRHYQPKTIQDLTKNKQILLEQKSQHTTQILVL